MAGNVGTIKKFVIDGTTYDVSADSKAGFTTTKYKKEGQATTGDTLFKYTKQVQVVKGIDAMLTPKQKESLSAKADSLADVTMAISLIDGSVYRGTGRVEMGEWDSDTGKCPIDLIPKSDWTPFLAS